MTKQTIKKLFSKIYPKGYRLLAVQLNGFSHTIFFDKKGGQINVDRFSHCMTEGKFSNEVKEFFKNIPNYQYQNNAKEFVFVLPENR